MKLPQDFIDKYTHLLGDEAPDFFESLDQDSVIGFRLNPLKNDYRNIKYSLNKTIDYTNDGFIGKVSGRSLEHQTGYVYSQDLSAMYVAIVADAKPGEKVLDLCAAPGGKSTQLAESMQNQGVLVSNEINYKRAKILAENMERIGAKNVVVTNESPDRLVSVFKHYFDKIVVDAPCSGEGMFRKDHAATKYWHKEYPNECAKLQKEILVQAMQMLKSGGELIYSTCTFAPEENEEIVSWLLENYDLTLEPIKRYDGMEPGRPEWGNGNPTISHTVRLMSHKFQGEGQFLAKFKDNTTENKFKVKKKKAKKSKGISPSEFGLWNEFIKPFKSELSNLNINDLKLNGDYLYYYPQELPDIEKLKYMRPGLALGIFKKNRFEPSYALALSLNEVSDERVIKVTKEQWKQYVAGDVIPSNESKKNGWYLLETEGKYFAFGKLVNGTIKNFMPKGLRFTAIDESEYQ